MTGICGIGLADASNSAPGPKAGEWPFTGTPTRWGRFDPPTRALCLACGFALRDAESRGEGVRLTGLVRAGRDCCHAANRAYFSDYVQGGRTLGRSSLFVHTLPTSPAAEAALLFGLRGPNFYLGLPDARFADLLDTAADVLQAGGAERMLAVAADGGRAVAILLSRQDSCMMRVWPAWTCLPLAPLPPAGMFASVSNN